LSDIFKPATILMVHQDSPNLISALPYLSSSMSTPSFTGTSLADSSSLSIND
jgi:hypothetical protein